MSRNKLNILALRDAIVTLTSLRVPIRPTVTKVSLQTRQNQ
jgi:hypothetical protein